MEYVAQTHSEMIEYNVDSMLSIQSELQNNEISAINQDYLNKDYIKGPKKSFSDISTLEFNGSSHLNQASLSSFALNSTSFIGPSSVSASSSCNSVVSSSSLVSNSSICSREGINIVSKNYITQEQQSNIPVFDKDELKILSRCLPHTKIKKIIKCSGAVNHMIGSEVPALLAIACELFVRDLTSFSWNFTKRAKRRTVQVQDIKSVSSKDFRLRRLLYASKSQLRNILSENESLEQNKNPILDYYRKGEVQYQGMQMPIPNIQSAQIYPKYFKKPQNNQENISKQGINRYVNHYHNVNQELQKSYMLSPNQHIQHSINQFNGNNINYYNSYNEDKF
ncbi:CCAAT-binding factor chain HAP5 like histone [Cryptosporidium ubiquitum]|uniref:CCAAT-binding factor chain HAP5 like histone n=1 Tax=Cryptosporidium ubiquitum TaxID=857276 RepID=A0A1J4MCG5_9CRYT|nr:CCAAT-binding factor chain HAP5 like histone [Cryptosporidium ubiquitum]OII71663.1 CCAAT-binding factor chain HAP5 like histone [Cryptosporidium ubiquitum]